MPWLMSFGMVLWIALLVVLVWAVIRWLNRRAGISALSETSMPVSGPSAREILGWRYARGEIDPARLSRYKSDLRSAGALILSRQPVAVRFNSERLYARKFIWFSPHPFLMLPLCPQKGLKRTTSSSA